MSPSRWRVAVIEEPYNPPAIWQPPARRTTRAPQPGEVAMAVLLGAFELLSQRGAGHDAWAASFRHDPIAFLLDSMSDALTLRDSSGRLIYRNRAAAELDSADRDEAPLEVFVAGGKRFERRCLRCRSRSAEYILEVVHEVEHDVSTPHRSRQTGFATHSRM